MWVHTLGHYPTGTKHFVSKPLVTTRIGGYGQGPFGIGPYGEGYHLIDYGEDAGDCRWQSAAHLLEVVVRFWRDFFRTYRRGADLPFSKRHVD